MEAPHIPSSSHPAVFTRFSDLPTELQLKIWRTAAYSTPRAIDLWSDFKKCEQRNVIYYFQHYTTDLSCPFPPILAAILSTCQASRSVALKAYELEFHTEMAVSGEIYTKMPAIMYINFSIDTIAPRGYYNAVSFPDFVSRVEGRLSSVALDINGTFWKDHLRLCLKAARWALNGVQEVLLYLSTEELRLKDHEGLERFRNRDIGGRDLTFVEIDEGAEVLDVVASDREGDALSEDGAVVEREMQEASLKALKEVQGMLEGWFDIISGATAPTEKGQILAMRCRKNAPQKDFVRL